MFTFPWYREHIRNKICKGSSSALDRVDIKEVLLSREHVQGVLGHFFQNTHPPPCVDSGISGGGELRHLDAHGLLLGTLAVQGGFSVIMTFPIFSVKSQPLALHLRSGVSQFDARMC